jgi:hypothetical protein
MLADYPIYFDDDVILNPKEWKESSTVIENVSQTEAGTDIHVVTRYDKLTVQATFNVTDKWAKLFKQYSKKPSFILRRYDVLAEDYEERRVVIRGLNIERLEKSEKIAISNGVYTVSFNIEEL